MTPQARILAVDDQLYFRSHLEEVLGGAGYAVTLASSGPEALETLERERFDVVLTDLVMPDMNGVEVVRRVRDRWPDQEIVVITAVGDVRSAVAAMRCGAADYLLKPIDPDGLISAIEGVLRQRRLRDEHSRLVSENLEFMGQLSLYERATAMFSLGDADAVAHKLLELYAIEAGADDGVIWLIHPETGLPRRAAVLPPGSSKIAPELPPSLLARARAGESTRLAPQGEAGLRLLAPCVRGGVLFAVALLQIDPTEPGTEPDLTMAERTCARLGELGALALERLVRIEEPTLRELDASRDAPERGVEATPRRGQELSSATPLPDLRFLAAVADLEVHKAQRFGRSLGLLCVAASEGPSSDRVPIEEAVRACMRSTDLLARGAGEELWILVAEADPLGATILKRRIASRIGALQASSPELRTPAACLGSASFPEDGSSIEDLLEVSRQRAEADRHSLLRKLDLDPGIALPELCERLLEQGEWAPTELVCAAAELVISDLVSRPGDSGMLFLSPGAERAGFLAPLAGLGAVESATEVFVAVDGDTLPAGPSLHAFSLPAGLDPQVSWIVRFGEAPSYALIAGPPQSSQYPDREGMRRLFHASDPALVEHLAFRLREEVGLGMAG